jgi:esterase/lipase superfamily enzyme
MVFVTDRRAAGNSYGAERSNSMAFGTLNTRFDLKGGGWQALVDASSSPKASRIPLHIEDVQELGRFPSTPLPFGLNNGQLSSLQDPREDYEKSTKAFQETLRQQLKATGENELVLFIHGFNNDFEEAALSLAEVWHFTGRRGVPLLYTWPAGKGGITGYFTDRESGEFTIYHLKETLRIAAQTPGVERIHVVAHSRGTDVATTALRELVIETRAAGRDPRVSLKVENLILAAPDLDFGVVGQRLIAERFGPAFGKITVYTNSADGALGFSQFLMQGQRFGRIGLEALSQEERLIFSNIQNVHFIDAPSGRDLLGHSYYRTNPDVLSDLGLVIGSQLGPHSAQRNLSKLGGNFWAIPKR